MADATRLVLLSEFGEELVGFRTHLCYALHNMLQPSHPRLLNVLPTDIGLCVDLQNSQVRCTRCDGMHSFQEVCAVERGSDVLDYVPREVVEDSRCTCHWRSLNPGHP